MDSLVLASVGINITITEAYAARHSKISPIGTSSLKSGVLSYPRSLSCSSSKGRVEYF